MVGGSQPDLQCPSWGCLVDPRLIQSVLVGGAWWILDGDGVPGMLCPGDRGVCRQSCDLRKFRVPRLAGEEGGGLYPRCFFDGPPQIWRTRCGADRPAQGDSHCHPAALLSRPGTWVSRWGAWLHPPSPAPHTPLCHPPHPQGWLLSLLDDNTLHLWEVCQKEGCSHLEETRSFGLPGRPGSGSAKYLPGGVGAAPPRGCGQRDAAASWERRVGGMLAKLLSLMVFSPLGCSSDPEMLSAGNSSGVFMVLAGSGGD